MIKFDMFNDVENTLLRSYNRTVYTINILEDHGAEKCKEYLGLFDKDEQLAISALLISLKKFGEEATKAAVLKRIEEETK